MMKLSKLAEILSGSHQGEDVSFDSVSIDSRDINAGELFIALRGEQFDGHRFVDAAAKAGAVAAIVSESVDTTIPLIIVPDTQKALTEFASYWRAQFSIPVIGVTGSCGKTTTRALMASIFSECGNTLAAVKSFNNEIGVPLTLLRLRQSHEYAVIEMGANHPGEIAALTHLVKPDVAIITNAGPAHLEGFGDIEGVACAKGEIYQGLNLQGTAIINQDDQFASYWHQLAGSRKQLTFGIRNQADVMAENIAFNDQGQGEFDLVTPTGKARVKLPLIGAHNINNALAAASAASALSLPVEKIRDGLQKVAAEKRRLVATRGFANAMIIDDSYNANPSSVMAAMDVLNRQSGTSVFVFADMKELGEHSDELHRQIGAKANDIGITHLFCYGSQSRLTAEAYGKTAKYFENKEALIHALRDMLNENMTVLVKGSNSMGMDKVTAALLDA